MSEREREWRCVCVCDLESGCSAGAADRWRWAAWWVIYGENRGILPPSVAVTHAPPCSRFSRITYTVIRPRAHATRPAGGRAGLAVSSEVAGGWWVELRSQPASQRTVPGACEVAGQATHSSLHSAMVYRHAAPVVVVAQARPSCWSVHPSAKAKQRARPPNLRDT